MRVTGKHWPSKCVRCKSVQFPINHQNDLDKLLGLMCEKTLDHCRISRRFMHRCGKHAVHFQEIDEHAYDDKRREYCRIADTFEEVLC